MKRESRPKAAPETEPHKNDQPNRTNFAQVPEWLIDAVGLRAFKLWALLDRFENKKTRLCCPSRSTLASRLRCSVDSVDRGLDELVGVGALTIERRFSDQGQPISNMYVLHRDGGRTPAAMGTDAATGGRSHAARWPQDCPIGSRTDAAQNDRDERKQLNEREHVALAEVEIINDNPARELLDRLTRNGGKAIGLEECAATLARCQDRLGDRAGAFLEGQLRTAKYPSEIDKAVRAFAPYAHVDFDDDTDRRVDVVTCASCLGEGVLWETVGDGIDGRPETVARECPSCRGGRVAA